MTRLKRSFYLPEYQFNLRIITTCIGLLFDCTFYCTPDFWFSESYSRCIWNSKCDVNTISGKKSNTRWHRWDNIFLQDKYEWDDGTCMTLLSDVTNIELHLIQEVLSPSERNIDIWRLLLHCIMNLLSCKYWLNVSCIIRNGIS